MAEGEVFEPTAKVPSERCPQNPEGHGHTLVRGIGTPSGRYWVCKYGCGVAAKRTGERLPALNGPGGHGKARIP